MKMPHNKLQNNVFLTNRQNNISLKIKNFLVLDDVDIKFSRVVVFIGPQAEGKSLLAKLIYFFYQTLESIGKIDNISQFINKAKKEFTLYFSKDTWQDTFTIDFTYNNYCISIFNNNKDINITIDNNLSKFINEIIDNKNKIEKKIEVDIEEQKHSFLNEKLSTIPRTNIFLSAFRQNRFLSEKNSMFLMFEKNLDPLLYRSFIHYSYAKRFLSIGIEKFNNKNYVDMLKGRYVQKGDDSYIQNRTKKNIPLDNTSSGQQELFPLLLCLRMYPVHNANIFIEEPEAHLYPQTQIDVLSEMLLQSNIRHSNLIITTHSPYILSALNNHIAAYDVVKTNNEEKIKKMKKILHKNTWLNFDDVNAFFINNGTAKNIMDRENRMIDFYEIDKTIEHISNKFNDILEVLSDD